MTRVLVCGGRDFADRPLLFKTLTDLLLTHVLDGREPEAFRIIHGGARRGADSLAGAWATLQQVRADVYRADWKKHGKSAGLRRNQKMLDDGEPDLVVAFLGGGTEDMVRRATDAGVRVLRITSALAPTKAAKGCWCEKVSGPTYPHAHDT